MSALIVLQELLPGRERLELYYLSLELVQYVGACLSISRLLRLM